MPKGFFPESTLISKPPLSLIPKCGACGLHKTCQSPKMPPSGKGRRKVLIVGEAPGAHEDEQGVQFVGKAGQFLQERLNELGVRMRTDCYITNALICRPPGNKIENKNAVDYCRPNLLRTLEELEPHTVVLLGGTAVRSLVGALWKEDVGPLERWVGWNIPCTKPNVWICPTYHPSYLLRSHDKVLDRLFMQHLEAAFAHEERPWEQVPDYGSQVEVILDPDVAARAIREITEAGGPTAFDYETTGLKPEYEGVEAVCASICWRGVRTIAYPWHGEAIKATGEYLASDRCTKIASNLKHEDRWTRHIFGHPVRGWLWDTMLAAHVLDNREGGICGLKFQAFVRLGAESYNDHIEQFMQARKGKHVNRVKQEIEISQLLRYCGIDTLLEYLLAKKQMKDMRAQAETLLQ